MNSLTVNGKTRALDINQESSGIQIVDSIYKTINSSQELVTSILIDGVPWDERSQETLSEMKLAEIQSVEVKTEIPAKVATDSLTMLKEFLQQIESNSLGLSKAPLSAYDSKEFLEGLLKLVGGIEMISDTLQTTRNILRWKPVSKISFLEADLLSILQDLLAARENNQHEFTRELLAVHLPENLRGWQTEGIPGILKSIDEDRNLASS